MRVLLIAGGWSGEREVSLSGARQIEKALESLGHEPDFFDLSLGFPELLKRAKRAEFAFINLHGSPGEDGLVQALLEAAGTPYQGAGPAGSFLALNKAAAKAVFQAAGLPTPPWELVTSMPENPADLPRAFPLELPVFVKPNMGGSSLGMGLVERDQDLVPALETVFHLGEEALVESYMEGQELTCGVLGEEALPLILIRPKPGSRFFDYANKYDADGAEEICPAPVDKSISDIIQAMTLRAHHLLGLTGYSRADFIWAEHGPFILEVNTLPGMTPTSLVPRAAKAAGYSFEELIAELIRLGME